MPSQKPSKAIFDTNLWISFLIGKELRGLKDLILNDKIKLIISDQLIEEITLVTSRDKLKKYFNQEKVDDLLFLLNIVSEKIKIPLWLYEELQEDDFLQGKTPVLFVDMCEEEE